MTTFTNKYFYTLGSILLTGYLIVISRSLFNPLLAAFIMALALRPIAATLETVTITRLWSTVLSILLFMLIFIGFVTFCSLQIGNLDFNVPTSNVNLDKMPGKIQKSVTKFLGVSPQQQGSLGKEALNTLLENSVSFVNHTLYLTTTLLTAFIIFILSLFFFLYYRSFLVAFLFTIFHPSHHLKLADNLVKIQIVVNSYMIGLSFIILIVAVLNSIGLFALGIENAILFGVMGSVLTLIPYIGIMLGALLPAAFALFTKNSLWYPFGVIIVFMIVQFLEGNFLTPNIVGSQVSINPFAALLALIIGGMLLGLLGVMFAIPVLAIIKVICDDVDSVKPLGYLLGKPYFPNEQV